MEKDATKKTATAKVVAKPKAEIIPAEKPAIAKHQFPVPTKEAMEEVVRHRNSLLMRAKVVGFVDILPRLPKKVATLSKMVGYDKRLHNWTNGLEKAERSAALEKKAA